MFENEKQRAAFISVCAAVFLTTTKAAVGVFTGSLGILSEAAHSLLDLGAAIITLFAIKISSKPADHDHNYGHDKVESFSALIETLLLLITCVWIVYEAIGRLFFGNPIEITNIFWGTIVIGISIIIDISRSVQLNRVANKYHSQALQADALHFSSDVLSSIVVFLGLICTGIGNLFGMPALKYADPIAALGVSILVAVVSIRLLRRSIDILLDASPKGVVEDIRSEIINIEGVESILIVRVRPSGAKYFIDIQIGVNRFNSQEDINRVVSEINRRIQLRFPDSDILVSTLPIDHDSDVSENRVEAEYKKSDDH